MQKQVVNRRRLEKRQSGEIRLLTNCPDYSQFAALRLVLNTALIHSLYIFLSRNPSRWQ
jgi:hypothetical protein